MPSRIFYHVSPIKARGHRGKIPQPPAFSSEFSRFPGISCTGGDPVDINILQTIVILCLTALLLLLFALRYDPQKPHARYLRHGVVGLLMLCVWNCLPLPELGMNPLSVMVTGALGLPGRGLMAVMNMLP